jgi:hypothetical protein
VVVHPPGDVGFDDADGGGSNGGGGQGGGGGGPAPAPYIEFVRLPYDVETTVKKVEAIPELDDFLGTRLLDGR